jgi:hypothetical protein
MDVMRRLTLTTTVLAALLLSAGIAGACPMCKDTISDTAMSQPQDGSGGPQASLPSGFNFSIYYMLTGLLCTIGLVAGVITKGVRDSNASMRRGFPTSPKK